MESAPSQQLYKHVILAKLKEGVPQDKLLDLLKKFASLPFFIPGMKSFHWARDESKMIKHKGYNYVFEVTFESIDDISNYYDHPGHTDFANEVATVVEDYIVVNYKPMVFTIPGLQSF